MTCPTLRGLVTGTIPIGRQTEAIPVVVWGDEFPSWLLVLGELRLRAAVVILSSPTHTSLVKSLVAANCLIVTAEDAWSVLTPATTGECSLCLVDGRVGAASARLLETCGVTRILGTRGL